MGTLYEGEYFYARHRNKFGVWKVGKEVNGVRMDQFIMDFSTKLDAERFVYRMNGWTKNNTGEDE